MKQNKNLTFDVLTQAVCYLVKGVVLAFGNLCALPPPSLPLLSDTWKTLEKQATPLCLTSKTQNTPVLFIIATRNLNLFESQVPETKVQLFWVISISRLQGFCEGCGPM